MGPGYRLAVRSAVVEVVAETDVVVVHVVDRDVMVDPGLVPGRVVQCGVVQTVVLVAAEAQADRVHGVVQPVEAGVVVLAEVVLDVPEHRVRGRIDARIGADMLEQAVCRRRVLAGADVLLGGLFRPEPEAVIVVVFRIVHSHGVHRPPIAP